VWVGEGDFDTGQFGIKGKFDTYQLHVVALASQGAAIFRISKSDDTPLVTVHNDGLETIFGGTEYLDDDVDTTCGAGNYNISADASETQLKVCNNGVKSNLASPLTTNGDLHYHNGTVDSRLARGSDGQCLTSNASSIVWGSCAGAGGGDNLRAEDGDNTGAFTAMVDADFDDSGDINFARAAGPPDVITGTVRADSVALTTDTTGNYLSEVAAGTGIAVSGAAGEGFTKTVSLDYTDAGTDPGFAAGECRFSNEGGSAAGWVCEGETADALETRFRVTDPTSADRIVTIPNADSTTVQSASCSGGDRVSAISSAGVVTCTATPSLARIAGASGAAGADLTWQNLTSDSADCTTTALCSAAMTTTGVGAGTWAFTYTLLYQTAVNTTGIAFGINHTGTATLPGAMWVHTTTGTTTANATGDSAATTAAGQLSEGRSGLTLNAVIGAAGAGVDTANTNILAVLSGILVVTGSGSLELKLGSEVGSSAVRIMADSVLELRKIE
jgi:hypothetical protein